jgi:YbgC/YbaW family acyl-CoA thioester hydrolase
VLIEREWRVTMADVDAAGILYYASPLRWAEMLLGDWLERSGHSLSSMFAAGEATPAAAVTIRYRVPLSLDDHCSLRLSAGRIGKTSFTVCCAVWGTRDGWGDERLAVEVESTHTYVSLARRPGGGADLAKQPLPAWLTQALDSDPGAIADEAEGDDQGGDE